MLDCAGAPRSERVEDQALEAYRREVGSSRGPCAPKAGWTSPLTHPVWWIALAIMLVNDLALKRSNLAFEGESPDAGTASPRACDVVVIRVAGMVDTAVFWNHVSKVRLDTTGSVNGTAPHALHLERFSDSLVVERTPLLDVWPVDWPLPPVTDACNPAP